MASCRCVRLPCHQVVRGYPRAAFIRGGPNLRGGWTVGSPPPVRGSHAAAGVAPSFLSHSGTEPLTLGLDMCDSLVQGTAPAPAVWDHRPIQRGRRGPYIAGTQSLWKGGTSQQMIQFVSSYISTFLSKFRKDDEDGQTLVEYGLLLALIAIIVIVALLFLGPIVSRIFQNVGSNLSGS